MSYLLDTCCVSELVRPRPDQGVVNWVGTTDERLQHLSVLTIGEIAKGVARIDDSARRSRLDAWVHGDLLARFDNRLLPIDHRVVLRWGALAGEAERRGMTLPLVDSLLAATALTHDLIVVTRNVRDLERCGARCLNPWTTGPSCT